MLEDALGSGSALVVFDGAAELIAALGMFELNGLTVGTDPVARIGWGLEGALGISVGICVLI